MAGIYDRSLVQERLVCVLLLSDQWHFLAIRCERTRRPAEFSRLRRSSTNCATGKQHVGYRVYRGFSAMTMYLPVCNHVPLSRLPVISGADMLFDQQLFPGHKP